MDFENPYAIPMAVFSASGEKTRFDFTTMLEEWKFFIQNEADQPEFDPQLVTVLAVEHMETFVGRLREESIAWNPLEGLFAMPKVLVDANGGELPITRDDLDQFWSDAFDAVSGAFDDIESIVAFERKMGLI